MLSGGPSKGAVSKPTINNTIFRTQQEGLATRTEWAMVKIKLQQLHGNQVSPFTINCGYYAYVRPFQYTMKYHKTSNQTNASILCAFSFSLHYLNCTGRLDADVIINIDLHTGRKFRAYGYISFASQVRTITRIDWFLSYLKKTIWLKQMKCYFVGFHIQNVYN